MPHRGAAPQEVPQVCVPHVGHPGCWEQEAGGCSPKVFPAIRNLKQGDKQKRALIAPAFSGNFHQPLIHWVGLQLSSCFITSLPNCLFHDVLEEGLRTSGGWDCPPALNVFGCRIS